MSKRIPVAGPWITEREVEYVADAAQNAWYDNAASYHNRFEALFAQTVGTRFAIALPHCTSAIHLALVALGVGPGDEVIVPECTWIATAAPVRYVGAEAVFADIDRVSWCLNADSVESCLTPKTKAVIAVDLYGGMPNYSQLQALCDQRGILLLEDAAQAVGAKFQGQPAGSFGRAATFSFHGSKTLTTGEGGMLCTDDSALRDRVLFLRDHGRDPGSKLFLNSEVAFKYRMSATQAAMGLAQTERLAELVAKKRQIFSWYQQRLQGVPGLQLNSQLDGVENAYWMSTVVVDRTYGLDKVTLMGKLSEAGIDTRPFFTPLSAQQAYSGTAESTRASSQNRVAYAVSQTGINLPSALCLTEDQVDHVCGALRKILSAGHKRETRPNSATTKLVDSRTEPVTPNA